MGFLTVIGTGFGAYIMAMAALSPCPLLVHSASGTAIIVRLFLLINRDIQMFYLNCKIHYLIAAVNFGAHALSCKWGSCYTL